MSEDQLNLGEGQDMRWFALDEVLGLGNTADGIATVIKQASIHINSL
ncbi:MAG: hypothetical protein H8D67_26080 [Deltaproteobacteria bacterium]|nr:hypothetical protein [Deltaproteobacteria bacterium]